MLRVFVVLLLCTGTAGCIGARRIEQRQIPPDQITQLDASSKYLKAHMRDGTLLVLRDWLPIRESRFGGNGVRLGVNRDTISSGPQSAPIDSVLLFETNVLNANPSTPLAVMTVITGAIALACIASPKSCFGSCPTFYAGDGTRILAEGFSASIAPALEATDVDRLEIAPYHEQSFTLRMTNEALETHVIRSLRMLTFAAKPGTSVFAAKDGYWRVADPIAPACSAREGSCTGAVAAVDGVERFSSADSTDLAAREDIKLEFDVPADGEYALVLSSRQTLLHTYVLYQTLAFMGSRAGEYIAALSRGDMGVQRGIFNLARALGGIEVGAPDSDRFLHTVHETGPLAIDSHLVPLGELTQGAHSLRLRMAQGHWRIDRIAIARVVERVEPVAVVPHRVVRNRVADREALAALLDAKQTIASMPGDEFEIAFEIPRHPAGTELFLEARGYYLEWMRSQWLAEENHASAQMMLFDPQRGLRVLAPEFKKWEPSMESFFWNSRYVRN